MSDLRRELAAVLNRHSAENISNTPDFILAHFLEDCLKAFDTAALQRADWYGRRDQIGQTPALQPSALCEECGGTGIVERKEDSAPMECWACSPQPNEE